MRNLLQYPITLEEKLDLLKTLMRRFDAEGRLGDMRPLLLRQIMEDVTRVYSLEDRHEGMKEDLREAVRVAYRRGALTWTRLNYPDWYEEWAAIPPNPPSR